MDWGTFALGSLCGGAIVGAALIVAALWWLKDYQVFRP